MIKNNFETDLNRNNNYNVMSETGTETTHSKPEQTPIQEVSNVVSIEEKKQRKRDKAREYYQRKKEAKLVEEVKRKVEADKELKRIPISPSGSDTESQPPQHNSTLPDKTEEKISELVKDLKEIVKKRQPRKTKK